MIEPDGPHRPAFAAWGLAQDPPLQTATASGWLVPFDLYATVPAELLDGAYVDGFQVGQTLQEAHPGASDGPVTSVPPRGEEVGTEAPEAAPIALPVRKRRTRKAAAE